MGCEGRRGEGVYRANVLKVMYVRQGSGEDGEGDSRLLLAPIKGWL